MFLAVSACRAPVLRRAVRRNNRRRRTRLCELRSKNRTEWVTRGEKRRLDLAFSPGYICATTDNARGGYDDPTKIPPKAPFGRSARARDAARSGAGNSARRLPRTSAAVMTASAGAVLHAVSGLPPPAREHRPLVGREARRRRALAVRQRSCARPRQLALRNRVHCDRTVACYEHTGLQASVRSPFRRHGVVRMPSGPRRQGETREAATRRAWRTSSSEAEAEQRPGRRCRDPPAPEQEKNGRDGGSGRRIPRVGTPCHARHTVRLTPPRRRTDQGRFVGAARRLASRATRRRCGQALSRACVTISRRGRAARRQSIPAMHAQVETSECTRERRARSRTGERCGSPSRIGTTAPPRAG